MANLILMQALVIILAFEAICLHLNVHMNYDVPPPFKTFSLLFIKRSQCLFTGAWIRSNKAYWCVQMAHTFLLVLTVGITVSIFVVAYSQRSFKYDPLPGFEDAEKNSEIFKSLLN